MKFSCPYCRQLIEAHDNWAGRQMNCPGCQQLLTAPLASTAPGPVAVAPPVVTIASAASGSADIHRWLLLALICIAGAFLYLSRQELGILKPTMELELHISNVEYAQVVTGFQIAYIIGALILGLMCCIIGTRWTYGVVLGGCMIATLFAGFAGGVSALLVSRVLLGFASGGIMPTAIQSASGCAPRKLQAIVVAVILCGILSASLWAPLVVSALASYSGWRSVLFVTAGIIFLCFLLWGALSLWAHLAPATPATRSESMVAGLGALASWQSWIYVIARALIDPLRWFFMFWVSSYMMRTFGVSIADSSLRLTFMFLAGIGGALLGALISDIPALIGARLSTIRSIVIAASGILLLFAAAGAGFAQNLTLFIVLTATAVAAYESLSVNLYASIAGAVPPRGVGMVVGIGALLAGILGMVFPMAVGLLIDRWGTAPSFVLVGILGFLGTIPAFFVPWSLRSTETPRRSRGRG